MGTLGKTVETPKNMQKADLARVFVSRDNWRYLATTDVYRQKCPHKALVPGSSPGGPTDGGVSSSRLFPAGSRLPRYYVRSVRSATAH